MSKLNNVEPYDSSSTSEKEDLATIKLNNEKTKEKETVDSKNNNQISKKKEILHDIKLVVVTCILGFLFGFILEKCKVYEPKFIRQQMIFSKFLMMKMFFTALSTSMLSIFILNIIAKNRYSKVFDSYSSMLKSKSLLTIVSGGLILGLGMTIAGSCPGMVFVQMGAGVNYSYLTLIGGIIGALVHGLLNTYITKTSEPDPIASKAVFEVIKLNHFIVRGVFIVLLYGAVAVMEVLVPWKNDYQIRDETRPFFSVDSEVWHPILAGSLLGALQFFSLLIILKSLGNSSSYSTCVSLVFPFKAIEKFPYLKKFRFGLSNYVSLLFSLFIFAGSISSAFWGGAFNKAKNVHPYEAVLGGFLLVFGARLAGGCNTGHGISGSSHLFIGSIAAMMSMFASGILIGFYARTNDFFF